MLAPEIAQRFASLGIKESLEEYNFSHFRSRVLWQDARRTFAGQGVAPGETAPDFELPSAAGGRMRLSDLGGRPALLHFGSLS
jgi:hypothetical protein